MPSYRVTVNETFQETINAITAMGAATQVAASYVKKHAIGQLSCVVTVENGKLVGGEFESCENSNIRTFQLQRTKLSRPFERNGIPFEYATKLKEIF
jgi:hypothetical protein